jgi:hypothetical protein
VLFRRNVNPQTPGTALQKAARSRQVRSKPERRQVLKGEWILTPTGDPRTIWASISSGRKEGPEWREDPDRL